MGRWQFLPIALVAAVVVALPLLALTDTGVEHDLRDALGLETGECVPMTNHSSPWQTGPSLPFELDEPRAAALDGDIYLAGGITGLEELPNGKLLLEPSDRVLRFDPGTGRYVELASMPRPLNHIGLIGYDHDLFVLGGYGRTLDSNTSDAFYRYDPSSDRWYRMPDLPMPLAAMAVDVVGDRLIVAGGARNEVPVSKTFAFNFDTRHWSRLPNMPDRREHVGSATLGGDLYVLGGRTSQSFAVAGAASYKAGRRQWAQLPSLPVPTGGLAVVAAGDSVLAIGGGDDGAGTVTGAVQAWNPRTAGWKRLGDMRTPRHGHAAAVVGDRVWVFGGSACAYFASTDSVEWLPISRLGN